MLTTLSSQLIDSLTARDAALRDGHGAAYIRHARLLRILATQLIGIGC